MKKLLVSVLLLAVFSGLPLFSVDAEFNINTEMEAKFRPETGISLVFPTLNDSVWGNGSPIEGSVYHWTIQDNPDGNGSFFHLLVWKEASTQNLSLPTDAVKRFEELLKNVFPNKTFSKIETPVAKPGSYGELALSNVELSVTEMISKTTKNEEGEDVTETVAGPGYSAWVRSVIDHKNGVQFVFMGTSSVKQFTNLSGAYSRVANSFYFGEKSNAGLVTMLLIGVLILVGLVAAYVMSEKKKKDARMRRLNQLQDYDDYDDYDDDYDDYDDYDNGRGRGRASAGRGGSSSSRPAAPSRGRAAAPRRRR